MSPVYDLYDKVADQIKNIIETVRSPRFILFAFLHSFAECFK